MEQFLAPGALKEDESRMQFLGQADLCKHGRIYGESLQSRGGISVDPRPTAAFSRTP